MRSIAVYCGSSFGSDPAYQESAIELGKTLAAEEITLVYGGAKVGIMGVVADAVLNHGGKVIGVLPKALQERELAHEGLTEFYIVNSMHERKSIMAEKAEGFIALPGGIGTLEEFAEVFTWNHIGIHQKPCGLFNVNGYYDPLIAMINRMIDKEFLQEPYRKMTIVTDNAQAMINQFRDYQPPQNKWD